MRQRSFCPKLAQHLHRTVFRSKEYPQGLPDLPHAEQRRVDTANSIFCNICRLAKLANKGKLVVSIECLKNSYFWDTPWLRSLSETGCFHPVHFQPCFWGGSSNEWITWYVNSDIFDCLHGSCPGTHTHAKRLGHRKLKTMLDTAYPPQMCMKVADQLIDFAHRAGVQTLAVDEPKRKVRKTQATMAAAGRQPRGEKFPMIIPEFLEKTMVATTSTVKTPPKSLLSADECRLLGVPMPSKLLKLEEGKGPGGVHIAGIGILRSPAQFVEAACQVQHPFDGSGSVDDDTKKNMFFLLTNGLKAREQRCAQQFEYYEQRLEELAAAERLLHDQLEPVRQAIVADKKFLLFNELCRDAGVEDASLRHLQLVGVPLVGTADWTGQFEEHPVMPALTVEQLMKSSRWSRRMIAGSSREGSEDLRQAVCDLTLEEVEKGWLEGPLTESEVEQRVGPLFVASRRFGLHQSDKIRQIDNMSESLVNSAFGSSYHLELAGVDGISVLARSLVEAVQDDRTVQFKLSDGSLLEGQLHPTFSVAEARTIGGRTLDLEAAYKQVLVARSSLWANVLAVTDSSGVKRFFLGHVLPFGASAAVFGFNRIARAILSIGSRLFKDLDSLLRRLHRAGRHGGG